MAKSKSKTGLIIGIVAAIATLGIVGYAFRKQIFGVKPETNPLPPIPPDGIPNNSNGGGNNTPTYNQDFPLKKGSRGDRVKIAQEYLGITQDGIFGNITEAKWKAKSGKLVISSSDWNVMNDSHNRGNYNQVDVNLNPFQQ